MAGLDDELNEWLEQVTKLADLTPQQQAEITKVGADEYRQLLEETTRQKHYSHHNDKKYGHMANHITDQNTDVDGKKTGISTVGWDNRYHAMNAMRLNDGTVKIKADHFITNLQNSQAVKDKVLAAESKKYQELTKRDDDK